MVEETVEERGDGGGVVEELAPIVDRTIGRQECARPFVAAHDELEEVLRRGGRRPAKQPPEA